MSVSFHPVESPEEVERLASLADEIWHEYWPALIGAAQTDYMVEQFQSLSAIKRDMTEHAYEYWFIVAQEDDGESNADAGGFGEAGDAMDAASVGDGDADAGESTSESANVSVGGASTETGEAASSQNSIDETENGASMRTRIVGYTGGHVEPETNRVFISKIYLRAEERGKGFASATIRFYEDLCRKRGLHAAYLTVNKHNELGIRAYRAKGFETIDAVETDIGNGFIMDDYIMELQVPAA